MGLGFLAYRLCRRASGVFWGMHAGVSLERSAAASCFDIWCLSMTCCIFCFVFAACLHTKVGNTAQGFPDGEVLLSLGQTGRPHPHGQFGARWLRHGAPNEGLVQAFPSRSFREQRPYILRSDPNKDMKPETKHTILIHATPPRGFPKPETRLSRCRPESVNRGVTYPNPTKFAARLCRVGVLVGAKKITVQHKASCLDHLL